MVTIIPPRTNVGTQIGQSLGQGLAQSMSQAAQQQYQRGQLQQALNQARSAASQPGAKPVDVLLSLMQAGAGIPGSERYIGQIAPLLLQQAQANVTPTLQDIKGSQLGSSGAAPSPGQPIGQVPVQQQVQGQEGGILPQGKGIQLGNYLPYNLGDQISPEQAGSILDQVRRIGGDVDFARQQIRDYNAGKIGQTDLANANVDKEAAQLQRQLAMEKNVKSFLDEQLPNDTPEPKKNLYYNLMTRELPHSKDFTTAYQKVVKDIQNFDKLEKNWIGSIPEADFLGLSNTKKNQLRSTAQPLLKTDPLAYNILEEAMKQKGHSIVEVAKTLKPETPDLRNILSKTEDFRELIYPGAKGIKPTFKGYGMSDKDMLKNIDIAQKQQSASANKIADQLSSIWSDDISLINIYTELSKKGWFPEQIREIFDQISENFNSQQQVEFSQLNQHPQIPARYIFE